MLKRLLWNFCLWKNTFADVTFPILSLREKTIRKILFLSDSKSEKKPKFFSIKEKKDIEEKYNKTKEQQNK